jgi:hypothetical protein
VGNSIKGHNTATTKYIEFGVNIFELSQKTKDLFLKTKKINLIVEQRRLLKLVFTDMKLNEGVLTFKFTPTFSLSSEAVFMTNSSKIRKIEKIKDNVLEPIIIPIQCVNRVIFNLINLSGSPGRNSFVSARWRILRTHQL